MVRRKAGWLIVLAGLLALLLVALTGCGGSKAQAPPSGDTGPGETTPAKIVLADTPTTHHLNLYVAKEKGIFDKYGLDVQIQEVQDAAAARDAVSTGSADGYWACPTAVMAAVNGGAPIKIVAQVKKPCTSVLMVPQDSPINTIEDLQGKTIGGLGPSCCAVIFIELLADQAGVSFDLVNMAGGAAISALEAAQVDGIIVEEPHASIAELNGYKTLFRSEMKDTTCRTINFNENFLAENTEAVKKLVQAVDEANKLILANPVADDIVAIAVQYTRAPEDAIRLGNPRLGFTTQLTTDVHQVLAQYLVEKGISSRNVIPEAFAEEFKGVTWE